MNPRRFLLLGWWFTAVAMVAFGTQQIVLGKFATRITPGFPSGDPAPGPLVYLVSLAVVAVGFTFIVDRRRVRGFAILLGAGIWVSFLIMHLPRLIAAPQDRIGWLRALKGLTLAGGAFAVAATARRLDRVARRRFNLEFIHDRTLFVAACAMMGVYLIYCGYLHLRDPAGVARLVPVWVPDRESWAWFTGVALILGGAGFWLPSVRALAAALSSGMIFLWVILLHIPEALASSGFGSNATTATFEALAFSGLALIVAATSGRDWPQQPTVSKRGTAIP